MKLTIPIRRLHRKLGHFRYQLLAFTAFLLLLPLFVAQAAATEPTSLTFADRLSCTMEIEKVYWQNRLWPESNPGPKPPLTDVLSENEIAGLVHETLAYSLVLEQEFAQPLTGQMLQAELDRMASASRRPEVLQQLFAALDHDPTLIAECLVRPVLAERLLHEQFATDERLAGQDFDDWWAAHRPESTTPFTAPAFAYTLPPITTPQGGDDSWVDTASIPLDDIGGDVEGAAVWTGTEMVFIGDFANEAYRYNPATDHWQTTSTLGGPLGLRDMSAVWTGTYVVASNGCTANLHNCTTSLAWRYDPQVDFWEPIPNAPISRTDQSAVWTGTEMIVWGGCTYMNDICQVYSQTGARYNPDTNTWQTMSTAGAPAGRTFPNLVWTGTEMIVWGGQAGNPAVGGRYNPTTNTWSVVTTTNAPIGTLSTAVWSGSEMIAWGGCTGSPFCDTPHDTGARYDPDTDTWTPTSATNAPVARYDHEAVWIGDAMILWGGYDGSNFFNSGARYDPATDTWTAISSTNAPTGRIDHQLLWTDSLVLVWGGVGTTNMRTGGRYNPLTDSWSSVSTTDPDSIRTYHSAVWTGAEMIVWGGVGDGTASTGINTGRRYDPATDSWLPTATSGAPLGAWDANAVWTGTEMIVFGGQSGSQVRTTGGRYNPMTNSWTGIATHVGHTDSAHVWTGTEMLVWGGVITMGGRTNTGALYNPATNSWTDITTVGAPSAREMPGGFVWTGAELLVWGGFGSTGELGDGGRYDPDTDTWATISNTNAPQARNLHVAVWTGSEMIIYGGVSDYSPFTPLTTGGRYNPTTDTWTATSTANTPLPVARPEAVWTGAEMIVWGGECEENVLTCHTDSYEGGRYDPQTDTWTATTLDGVPEARSFHTAVWTGEGMLVWGGTGTWSGFRHTGGLYYAAAPQNSPPTASDDDYITTKNETLSVPAPGVLGNDNDPDGDSLTALLVSSTTNGQLVLNGDGSFTYTPDTDFVGTDTFTYQADDGQAASNVATATIVVNETPNNAPTAVDDDYTVPQDDTLVVAAPGLLANDSDPDSDLLTAALDTGPDHGLVTVNPDGSFTYSPDAGFSGTDTFTYLIADGRGGTDTAIVTITVTPSTDFPLYLPIIQG